MEVAICNSGRLSKEDSNLDDLFNKVKHGYVAEKRNDLIVDQRNWLKQRNSVCSDKDKLGDEVAFQECLEKVYSERTKVLRKILKAQKQNDR